MQFRRIFAIGLLCTAGLWAADRVVAYRAQLNGPSGLVNGVLVTVGDQLVFVNPDRPDLAFAIPRADVRSVTLRENGLIDAQVTPPYAGPYGQSSAFDIRLLDPAAVNPLIGWVGVPLAPGSIRTDTVELGGRQMQSVMFDVKHDDDTGRLIVTPAGIDFEDIANRSKSRHWGYAELKGVDRKDDGQIVIKPYHGDEFKVKTTSRAMDDAIYSSIADRIVAARPRP